MENPSKLTIIDLQILFWLQNHRTKFFNGFFRTFSFLANGCWFYLALPLCLAIDSRYRKAGYMTAIVVAIAAFIVNLGLKKIFRRDRPFVTAKQIEPLGKKPKDTSFPSGHSAVAFSCALMIALTLPFYIWIPLMVVSLLTCFSRAYMGVHYLSDVIAGIITGAIISLAIYHYYFVIIN